mmetsp:Transcript_17555/g.42891  ORF Transcript_17555/g.42891 Transcript_17555/m.42891 type:complete len:218 (+) Transcript_17555:245-898(+)
MNVRADGAARQLAIRIPGPRKQAFHHIATLTAAERGGVSYRCSGQTCHVPVWPRARLATCTPRTALEPPQRPSGSVRARSRGLGELEEEGRVLDLDEGLDVLEAGLHEREARLEGVVAEADVRADNVLGRRYEVAREELHKLVLHVLDEVETRQPLPLDHEHGQVAVRLLDAVVEHPDQHVGVLGEVHHQLLVLLHLPKPMFVEVVIEVEEEIVLAR